MIGCAAVKNVLVILVDVKEDMCIFADELAAGDNFKTKVPLQVLCSVKGIMEERHRYYIDLHLPLHS